MIRPGAPIFARRSSTSESPSEWLVMETVEWRGSRSPSSGPRLPLAAADPDERLSEGRSGALHTRGRVGSHVRTARRPGLPASCHRADGICRLSPCRWARPWFRLDPAARDGPRSYRGLSCGVRESGALSSGQGTARPDIGRTALERAAVIWRPPRTRAREDSRFRPDPIWSRRVSGPAPRRSCWNGISSGKMKPRSGSLSRTPARTPDCRARTRIESGSASIRQSTGCRPRDPWRENRRGPAGKPRNRWRAGRWFMPSSTSNRMYAGPVLLGAGRFTGLGLCRGLGS